MKGPGAVYPGVVATCADRDSAAEKANAFADRLLKAGETVDPAKVKG